MKAMAIAGLALAALALAGPASAEMQSKSGRFNGVTVDYKVLLPPGYDPARSYPVVLVFTGGGQEITGVENSLNADWKDEAAKRGYVIVSPGATGGHLFYESPGDKIFPAFLDAIRRDYHVTGKLHVAGHSNGGLSAYHVAAKYPAYFSTVSGYPGLLDPEQMAQAPKLKSMCLYMHAGENDLGWPAAMQDEADTLAKQGYRVKFTLEPHQGHRLKASEINLGPRLFDEIESCK